MPEIPSVCDVPNDGPTAHVCGNGYYNVDPLDPTPFADGKRHKRACGNALKDAMKGPAPTLRY